MKNIIQACDFYKTGHGPQYPQGTEIVYSNLTLRSFKHMKEGKLGGTGLPSAVFFGLQGFIQEFLIDGFCDGFFLRPRNEVLSQYERRMRTSLGPGLVGTDHIGALWDLGYLPLEIRALPEGTRVEERIPVLTIHNTLPEFFWLTNYLETLLSAELWKATNSATLAEWFRGLFLIYARETGTDPAFTLFQGHDFSMRGMSGLHDAAVSGSAHLLSFWGTDTVPAIQRLEDFYGANADKEMVGCSVPATEHSVMCAGGYDDEYETYRRIVQDLYPSGIVSIVSDTWDLWEVLMGILPSLKEIILNRIPDANGNAKVVIRPDTGYPPDILCGDLRADPGTPARKGALECLWEVFGGTENEKGYRELNPRVGLIYGDSITPLIALEILGRMAGMGFASGNIVMGLGSYLYQGNTKDTLGSAIKATFCRIKGEDTPIFKDPVTGDGVKKSASGLLRVEKCGDGHILLEDQSWSQAFEEDQETNLLQPVFRDGKLLRFETLAQIRERLWPAA